MKKFLKMIRAKWHGDIFARAKANEILQNKINDTTASLNCKIDEIRDIFQRKEELEKVSFLNQLITHNELLIDDFCDFISDVIKISRTLDINIPEVKNSVYYKFILNQKKIKKVLEILDYESRQTWQYLIYLWIFTSFFYNNQYGLSYTDNLHYSFVKLIQDLRGWRGYDLNSDSVSSPLKVRYCCDQLLKPGMFVIDGGAYTGDTAEIFSGYIGDSGKVYAFEPTEANFKKLKEKHLQNCECIQKGLYDRECNLEFVQFDNNGAANTFAESALKWGDAKQVLLTPVISIDKFVEDNHIPHIDFIKMDIEGMELSALKGAENTIRKFKPNMAICIYHNAGNDIIDVPDWLVSQFDDIYQFSIAHHSKGWWDSLIYAKRL